MYFILKQSLKQKQNKKKIGRQTRNLRRTRRLFDVIAHPVVGIQDVTDVGNLALEKADGLLHVNGGRC